MDVLKGKSMRADLRNAAPQLRGVRCGEREEEVVTEAQQQLKTLLRKQLDTSAHSVKSLLEQEGWKQFSPVTASYRPLEREVSGLLGLEQYRSSEDNHARIDGLRHMGLTEQEIELELEKEGLSEPGAKRRRYGPDPAAHEDRMRAIREKKEERVRRLEEPLSYSGVRHMGRHAMELEKSLFKGASGEKTSLQHLAVAATSRSNMAYPTQIMPEAKQDWKPRRKAESNEETATMPSFPPPLPVQVIERNRLTVAEILALPRFHDYTPGHPSKVLYVKNLHPKVSTDDLRAVFGHFYSRGGGEEQEEWPKVKVMTGRMKGQAFVEFDSVNTAVKALELVNGYTIHERPLIISYGRGKDQQ